MSRRNRIFQIADDFVSLLFPRLCQSCGEPLVRNEEVICLACLADLPRTDYHIRRENELEKAFWGRCFIEKAAAFAYYRRGGIMQELTHRLKYNGITSIGDYFGRLYGSILMESGFLDDIDVIVPVPLHPVKERKRGFNQSMVIAEAIGRAASIEVSGRYIYRRSDSDTQTRKSRVERWENVENIFVAGEDAKKGSSHLLLVDDVITTGSTIEACTGLLKSSMDVRVSVVALGTAIFEST